MTSWTTKLRALASLTLVLALVLALAVALAAAVGCYTGPEATPAGAAPALDGGPPSRGADDPPADAAIGGGAADGVPCDVAQVLATSCLRCHGARPKNGAPMSLLTYEDLVAPWDEDPTQTMADVSLARMKSVQSPMPPGGAVAASAIEVLDAWISAGTPRVSCGAEDPADGGPAPDPLDAGAAPVVLADGGGPADSGVCTSGATWAPTSPASALMAPGGRCLGCHYLSGGPTLTLAGTVYPTLHEPDDCAGTGAGVTVVIVDASGKSHSLPVNDAGNFLRVTALPMPYTARVVNGTKVREMQTPQTDGDCNGCHSATGGRAPGRITAP